MNESRMSELWLSFLPTKNQKVYLLFVQGESLVSISEKLNLPLEKTELLCQTTLVAVKNLQRIMQNTADKQSHTLNKEWIEINIQLGHKLLEKFAGSPQAALRIESRCLKRLYQRLFEGDEGKRE